MFRSAVYLAAVGAAIAILAAGCGTQREEASDESLVEVIDDAGHALRLDRPAQRVVSLIPARTDALLALGAADRLIARTRYDTDERLEDLPSVDNALTPSVEWLLAQQPELVIAWPDGQARTVVSRLREMGVTVYASDVETVDDVRRAVRHLGLLLGLEQRADSILTAIDGVLDSVRAAHAGSPPVSAAFLIGVDPPMVAGSGTFIHEIIEAAGGRNVFADAPGLWPQVGIEQLLTRDPDVLILATGEPRTGMADALRARPGWRNLRAIREGRLHFVSGDSVNRPGPSVTQTVRRFADVLHGTGRSR